MTERIYKDLTEKQGDLVHDLVKQGFSQKKIATTLKIAKQSVATYMRRKEIGKRRGWIPTDSKRYGVANGWQLHFKAVFVNIETHEVSPEIWCFSKFHKKYDYTLMYEEAKQHGRTLAAGDINYNETNEVWHPLEVYKEYKTHWIPTQQTLTG